MKKKPSRITVQTKKVKLTKRKITVVTKPAKLSDFKRIGKGGKS